MVVEFSRRDEVALITLNRPEALNALSFEILDELDTAFGDVARSDARVLEMVMTGRTIKADEAGRIGLVNRVVEGNAIEQALAFACEFTCYSLPALQFARSAVSRALDVPVSEGLKIEAELSTLA